LWNRVAGGEDAGRRWRAKYLELTYGCGAYRPYETLVREAAQATGLTAHHSRLLSSSWDELQPWDDAPGFVTRAKERCRVGVVTNCSEALGRRAAARIGVPFDVVVTSERAGFYKPHPAPYRMALSELKLDPAEVLFVAGSAFDLVGTSAVGMDTLWHNRAGLARPAAAPAPLAERPSLKELLSFVP
jgi:2-haloalkanoic acid dehalogenase type II